MNNDRDTRSNLIAILGLIVAIASLLFGDNLFQQLTGQSFFPPKSSPTSTSAPTSIIIATQSLEFFSTIPATVGRLRIYETGPNNERVYGNTFNQATTKYIGWALPLRHPSLAKRIDFTIHEVYYSPDGSMFFEGDKTVSLGSDSGLLFLTHGVGWNEAGRWRKGTYTLSILIENNEFIEAVFFIE